MDTHVLTIQPCIYPSVISRAIAVLDEIHIFREVPDGYLRVLVRIIKKINIAKPTSPIVASRATLAKESRKSIETVGRVVKWLEDNNLIQRTQKSRAGLRGSSSPLIPTKALLEALLLTSESKSYPQKSTASPVSADGSKSVSQTLNNLKENNRGPGVSDKSEKTKIQNNSNKFIVIDKVKIPLDLAWLVSENEMRATGVLALMRAAKDAKQRLSDVVAATKKYLENLTGRELFAYLKALLSKNKDYSGQVKTEAKLSQQSSENERIACKARELAGRKFSTRNGNIVVFVEKSGILTEIREGRRYGKPMDLAFLNALEDGVLISCN